MEDKSLDENFDHRGEDDMQFDSVSNEKLIVASDSLIKQNIEAYKELAK